MPDIYHITYDAAAGRYRTVDITAVLKHLEGEDYVEVETGTVTLAAEKPDLLTFSTRPDELHTVLQVGVDPEAVTRPGFDDAIAEPIVVHVTAEPKALPGQAAPPPVRAQASVRVAPLPLRVRVLCPAPDAFPWPALAERTMTIELLVLKPGPGEVPAPDVRVSLRRKTASKPQGGGFAPGAGPPRTTDAEGRVSFDYVPPTLEYRLDGSYFEEYEVLAGPEGSEQVVETLELPLSPSFKFLLEAVKEITQAGKEGEPRRYGLAGPEELVTIELPADAQVTAFEGVFQIEPPIASAPPPGPYRVAGASVNPHLWTGSAFVPMFRPADRSTLRTGPDGRLLWAPPGLRRQHAGRAFPPYVLTPDCGLLPDLAGDAWAEEVIGEYERQRDFLLQRTHEQVVSPELASRLGAHRNRYLEYLATRPIAEYPRLRAFTRLLGFETAYATQYHRLVKDLAGGFPGKVAQLFTDLLGVGFSVLTFGDNLESVVGSLRDQLMKKGWVQTAAGAAGKAGEVLGSAATAFFEYVIQPLANGFVRLVRAGLQALESAVGWIARWAGEGWAGFRGLADGLADIYRNLDGFLGLGECNTVDAICNWFFKLLELAWSALKAVFRTLVFVVSGLLFLAMKAAHWVLANCGVDWDALLGPKNLELLRRILGDEAKGWGGGWREALELFVQTKMQDLCEYCTGAVGTGPAGVVQAASLLPVDTIVSWRLDGVSRLIDDPAAFVPADEQPRIDTFSERTRYVYNNVYAWERQSAEIDEGLAVAELVVNIGVGVVMGLAGILKALASTLKIGAASLLKKLDAVQVGMSVVKAGKTLVWDVGGTMGLGLAVLWVYWQASGDAVEP